MLVLFRPLVGQQQDEQRDGQADHEEGDGGEEEHGLQKPGRASIVTAGTDVTPSSAAVVGEARR
jgi:hypothetical protein